MELVVDDLGCRRGGRTVFQGLSFRVLAGTAALIKGPNGVGKSSLLRLIAGFVPMASGSVRWGETDLADRTAFQEHVAYAGHLDAVKPALTVRQNVALWASVFAAAPGQAEAALDYFGLSRIADRPAAQCSAGQKRRLGLARLLVVDRPLWLLDEPTVSLDQTATAKVADLIRRHVAEGGLALVATHIDLGLGDAPIIEMTEAGRTAAADTAEDDAFLAGTWR